MKNLVVFLLTILVTFNSKGQCVATASNGDYTVTLNIYPISLVPSSTSCAFGYNYNIEVGYDIKITGTNPPSPITTGLYTSQGSLTCNNGTNGDQTLFVDLNNGNAHTTVISSSGPYSSLSDCNTATPSTYNCNSFSFDVQGPNLTQTVNCGISNIALPIKILAFTANQSHGLNVLNWEIADAIDFDYFQVQRSLDAKTFETASEKIQLTESNKYIWSEKSNLEFKNTYYRLVLRDKDGSINFSKIISVENSSENNNEVLIYPNPSQDEVSIYWDTNTFKAQKLQITDANGKILKSDKAKYRINFKEFKAGIYFITLLDNENHKIVKKFIKLD